MYIAPFETRVHMTNLARSELNIPLFLKGQSHGHTVIFKGLKMTFEKKYEKHYTTLISIKNTINSS